MKWRKIVEEVPTQGQECLISDGEKIQAGTFDFEGGYDPTSMNHWTGCNLGGYEWDFEFDKVLFYIPLSELPPLPNKGK